MRSSLVNIHQNRKLRIFAAIIDKGTLSDAAEHIGITQPAVSVTLSQLENELGKLVDRAIGRGKVRPTELGMKIYRMAKKIQALEDLMASAGGAV